ncbi:hypothetical protein CLV31_109139 [Algoriphagus aquaeductus]|uniref:Uncharacterized protein n=1 Tax=Algoriphagus aquaeductus TaxID=475299 RepID=A0A326RN26_9BACT|nr:hypothetical protein CLV31_109139 [Algoriphagus aquaeductus]
MNCLATSEPFPRNYKFYTAFNFGQAGKRIIIKNDFYTFPYPTILSNLELAFLPHPIRYSEGQVAGLPRIGRCKSTRKLF